MWKSLQEWPKPQIKQTSNKQMSELVKKQTYENNICGASEIVFGHCES